ncbi:4-hydroxyphenylacetate 3-hydroxylase N-terminal domain-containing protein [Actinomadura napierensis]|uniref:4-hydroxyphenylacetate 3-hydroxylase N-terminal domain-containing protein n=1 Tax=Actinomadura napierensis TaxID=267854 RepID=A0ABN3A4Q3_9ACTN
MMMTGKQYLDSLDDGRQIYLDGQRVDDVAAEPLFEAATRWVASGYDATHRPGDGEAGPYYDIPGSPQDLREQLELLLGWDMVTVTTAQGLLALLTAAARMRGTHPGYARRIEDYFEYCKSRDLRCVQAITDAKGNRKLPPSKQDDPDLYTRIVERRPDGIVVRGAKLHISAAAICHELVVMPTKMMKPGEEDWAVACAIPVGAPGVKIVNTTYAPRAEEEHFPYSSRYNMPEGFVVLDDVFVPNERVFLCGETEYSATFAHSLGLWERLGGSAHLAEGGDLLVGLAQLIAEANGLERVAHIKDKIAEMIIYATLTRAGLEAAIANAKTTPEGWVYPDELFTNAAKHYGAAEFNLMVRHLHDIAGGAVLTAPSMNDLRSSEVGPFVEKYMRTMDGVPAEYRMRLFHAIRDITADAYGGWQLVTMIQSGGGLYAQRLVVAKHYDMDRAKRLGLAAAGLTGEEAG